MLEVPEKALGGIPLGLGLVVKIVILHVHVTLTHQLSSSVDGRMDHPQQTGVFLIHFGRPDGTVDVDPFVHTARQQTTRLL